MESVLKFSEAEERIVTLRGAKVIPDSDLETRRVNEAVRNNPDKFPEGYIRSLTKEEKNETVPEVSKTKFSLTLSI